MEALLRVLPTEISTSIKARPEHKELLEIILDLGRVPVARFPSGDIPLGLADIEYSTIHYVCDRVGDFGADNRAGIERTLHRISALKNRRGEVVGLTCRRGRAIFGQIEIVRDIVESGKSILLLGPPGIGKTTMLREMARVMASELEKRAVVVDTSNEIAGDGDIPHEGIGSARRMQVPTPDKQHHVMIEAVENHMPEVIIIDEIGTELEASAARTIAERGVQLIGTAHGNKLENLLANPTLSDLIGGIETVTLGDEEARRRGTQKAILERRSAPTFDILIEIQSRDRLSIHPDVSTSVDALLLRDEVLTEIRTVQNGQIKVEQASSRRNSATQHIGRTLDSSQDHYNHQRPTKVYPFGISRKRLAQAASSLGVRIILSRELDETDVVITLRNYYQNNSATIQQIEDHNIPVYVLRNSSQSQIQSCISDVVAVHNTYPSDPFTDTENAARKVASTGRMIELPPADAFTRRQQHEIAEQYSLSSKSVGNEPHRRVRFFTSYEEISK